MDRVNSRACFDRRGFLKIGSLSVFGLLSWRDVLAMQAASRSRDTKVSVIHFFLSGGMSQLDTLDMKPEARTEFRSVFKSIKTNVPGVRICEHLPLLAKQADKYTIIRTLNHKSSVHELASYIVLSGQEPLASVHHPSMGAVISKELGARNELPPYITVPAPTNWEDAGYLTGKYAPFAAGNPNRPNYSIRDILLPMGMDWARMERRYSLRSLVDDAFRSYDAKGTFEAVDSFYQNAHDLIRSAAARKAFDIGQEPETIREKYGRTTLGQGALLARRLVEAGVRFVTLSNGHASWDHHGKIFDSLSGQFLPELDRAFASLIEDLNDRGMLDSTLVIVTGEFGRTPEINQQAGRDHWPNAFSMLIAGAGVPGGQVWGATDSNGMYVEENPVEVPDLVATVFDKLGINYHKEYLSSIERPFKLSTGKPLEFLYS